MAKEITFKAPNVQVKPVIEFIFDAIIVIAAGWFASQFFLSSDPDISLKAQIPGLLCTLAVALATGKWAAQHKLVDKG